MKPLIAALMLALVSMTAHAADAPARKARVAQGGTVTLADSGKSPAEWTVARPNVRALRPRARGNFD